MSKPLHRQYDIVIIGGALVGAATACALHAHNPSAKPWRILVVDQAIAPPFLADTDFPLDTQTDAAVATTALNRSSVLLCEQLGIWHYCAKHYAPISEVAIYEQASYNLPLSLKWSEVDATTLAGSQHNSHRFLGAVLPTRRLRAAFYSAVYQDPNIEWCANSTVTDQRVTAKGFAIKLDIKEQATVKSIEIACGLLLLADGASSIGRNRLGIAVDRVDYQQTALLFNSDISGVAQHSAIECFLTEGSLALLPIPHQSNNSDSHRALWVRCASHKEIARLQTLDDKALSIELLKTLNSCGLFTDLRISHCSSRRSRALQGMWAREQYRRACVLLGDAAHSLHPIAAQGFNLSLRDVVALAKTLARYPLADLGDLNVLSDYSGSRFYDQHGLRLLSTALPFLFDHPSLWAQQSRRQGLNSLKQIKPLRRLFTRMIVA